MRLVHSADLHLGGAFVDLPDESAAIRREEIKSSFSKIVDAAKELGASAFFISGDLFDSASPSPNLVRFAIHELSRIPEIPVFIAAGNHDPKGAVSYYSAGVFPENVTVFPTSVTRYDIGENVSVYGASFSSAKSAPFLEGFSVDDPSKINLMCIHGEIKPQGDYNPISASQIEKSGLDYLALGHNHTRGVEKHGKTTAAWCGCHDGRGFDETGEKGFYIVDVDKTGCGVTFKKSSSRIYHDISLDASEFQTSDDVINAVREMLDKNDLYKITLTGESDPAAFSLPYILRRLSEHAFFVKAADHTRLRINIEAVLAEESALGYLARALKAKAKDDDEFVKAFSYVLSLASEGGGIT